MRKIFILFLLTLPFFLLSRGYLSRSDNEAIKAPFKLRSDIHDYLTINDEALDPLEGFWSLNIQRTLYDNNVKVENITHNNRKLTKKEIEEAYEAVKIYNPNEINMGYLCSTQDSFLILICYLFRKKIIHKYLGNKIIYDCESSVGTLNFSNDLGHFIG